MIMITRTVLILMTILGAGCAMKSVYIDLDYPPVEVVPYQSTGAAGLSRADTHSREVAIEIIDRRERDAKLGNFRLGVIGEGYSEILTESNIQVWIYDAVAAELALLGHLPLDVRETAPGTHPDRLTIALDLIRTGCVFWCSGEVEFHASIFVAGEEAAQQSFSAEISKTKKVRQYLRMNTEALAMALQTSIREMLVEFEFAI